MAQISCETLLIKLSAKRSFLMNYHHSRKSISSVLLPKLYRLILLLKIYPLSTQVVRNREETVIHQPKKEGNHVAVLANDHSKTSKTSSINPYIRTPNRLELLAKLELRLPWISLFSVIWVFSQIS
jgi:hypothetical protein